MRPSQNSSPPPVSLDPRRSRQRMVRDLKRSGITDDAVLQAMAVVPRHLFVEEALRVQAYEDIRLPIGYGQTLSQPSTVALMTQRLEVLPGMRVLEIGTGSGYQAAVLAVMGCRVYSIERIAGLYRATRNLLRQLSLRAIHMVQGDGTLGLPTAAPFERIIVTAGGPEIPRPLLQQLADGGILLIPVGDKPRTQRLLRVQRRAGRFLTDNLGPATFVDLVGSHGW